jgi:putative peptide zinc metalloprotease protein
VRLRDHAPVPLTAAGEGKWLLAYAPLSFAYRIGISVAIVLWLGSKWLILGLFALAYMVISVLLRPLLGWARQALAAAAPGRELNRVRAALAGLALAAGLLLFVVPLPFTTVAPAVVWLPEQAQVRPAVDGFIVELPVRDGEHVQAGQLLAVLDNPDLLTARERILSRLEGQRADQYQLMLRDPVGAQNLAEEIARNEAELARAQERIAQLNVYANVAGRLSMPRQSDLIGVNARQGVALGYVLDHAELRVRAAVAEEDAFLVRNRTRGAEVRLADAPDFALTAAVTQDVPAATRQLPTPALGDRAGGPYVTDPADRDGQRSVDPVFLFDLTLPGSALDRVGQRACVRFDHGAESLAAQLYRRALQVFLKHFNPAD